MLRGLALPRALSSALPLGSHRSSPRSVPPRVPPRWVRAGSALASDSDARVPSFSSLDELAHHLRGLTGDPLESDGGRIVTFRGDTNARVMIIGEAPGAEEDKLGVPFVGRAGKLLDEIFASVTLSTDRHCYVTNVVKRRPLNNRDPTAREIEWYRGYLREEIRLLNPAIIVCTGRHSMRTLLGKNCEGITKIRGRWFDVDGRVVMPMFHPSYLLRNPQRTPGSPKALTWDDIREVKRKVDELSLIEPEA